MSGDRIARFLAQYPKVNTSRTYQSALYSFLDHVYGPQRKQKQVSKEEKVLYEELSERYFSEGRNYFEDLMSFTVSLAGKPPIPAKARIAGVKEWLIFHDVEFTPKELKQLRAKKPKGNTARTAEHDITVPLLRKVLTHLDTKGRAFVLVLASSGIRIGEATTIDLDDIDLESTPATIVVRGETTKTGEQRTVFISTEAKEAVQEWLKVRARYLKAAQNRNKGLVQGGRAGVKTVKDTRLFPFTAITGRGMWNLALEKAGLWSVDRSTKQTQTKIHGLRKFFRSQLALTCPVDIVEALMGHEGYLTNAYRRYSLEQLGEYYRKGEHHITVQGGGDIKELSDKLQDTQAAMTGYKTIAEEQAEELVTLRRELDAVKEQITRDNDRLRQLDQSVLKDLFWEWYQEQQSEEKKRKEA